MGILRSVRIIVFLLEQAGKAFTWIADLVTQFLQKFNYNRNEADRSFEQRRYAEAANFYVLALADANRRMHSSSKKLRLVIRMAESYRHAGDLAAALPHAEDAVAKSRQNPQLCGQALETLSLIHEARGNQKHAIEAARQALQIAVDAKDAASCAERAGRLAELEKKAGNLDRAKELIRESLDHYQKAHGENNPGVATQLAAMAITMQDEGQLADALPLFEKAHSVHQQLLGKSARETLIDLEHIGQIHYLQGNLAKAVEVYNKLSRLKDNQIGAQADEHGLLLIDAATVHQAAGDLNRAFELLSQANGLVGRNPELAPILKERLAQLSMR